MKYNVFISYSHKDKDRVSLFASIMAQNGFDIWMDTKNIHLGDSIVSAIADILSNADIYMIFLSHNSNQSSWVMEELNVALTKSIANQKLKIIPVLLDDCTIPSVLTDRLYLDARKSIQEALVQLNKEFNINKNTADYTIELTSTPILSGAIFGLSKKTDISIGTFCGEFTIEDLIKDRNKIQKLLRKRANGILMNFVPLSDFDLQSPIPKYKNGIYDEDIEKVPGEIQSSICEKIMATATIFNPDINKINELIKNKLDKLLVTSFTYIYSIPFHKINQDKKCIQKLQDNFSIISYDFEDGVTIEYDSDFFLSIKCTLEQIQIKLQTEYDSCFSKKAVNFVPDKFISWLIS